MRQLGDQKLECVYCHSTSGPPGFAGERKRPYMQPISYARHCAPCHALELYPNGPVLPHTSLDRVKAQLADVKSLIAAKLPATVPTSGPSPVPAAPTELSPEELLNANQPTVPAKDSVSQAIETLDQAIATAVGGLEAPRTYTIKGTPSSDPAALEYYAIHGMGNSCFKCHVMTGMLQVDLASTQPAASTMPAKTVATGITATPRRWYTHSFFNHDVHRTQDCRECHMSIDSGPPDGGTRDAELAETRRLNLPGIEQCVRCHHDDNSWVRGAGVKCVTCHYYHDRSLRAMPIAPAAPVPEPMLMVPGKP
jgi:hypothetical protein